MFDIRCLRGSWLRLWFVFPNITMPGSFNRTLLLKKIQKRFQRLQAFAFCAININDEHAKPRFKRNLGVKFKDGICVELCL